MKKIPQEKTKFTTSFLWNGLESFFTQLLVTTHHIMLQSFSGAEFHGIFSAHLSILYTLIPIFNIGLDYGLSPFLKDLTQNRKSFLSLFFIQFLPQFLLTLFATYFIFRPSLYNYLFHITISPPTAFWLQALFLLEYIRKSVRSLLQLLLHTKITATTEILGTLFYMFSFWILIAALSKQLTLDITLQLFAFSVFVQTMVLGIQLIRIALSLKAPTKSADTNGLLIFHKKLNHNRLGIWANHIVSQINYSNVIVPFTSSFFGPTQASTLVILLNSARCVKLFFQKGLGTASLALLSQPSKATDGSLEPRYTYPLYYLYNFSIPLLLFFSLNAGKLSYLFSADKFPIHLAYNACFLSVIEGAISVYEKFFIANKKIYSFSALNTLGTISLFGIAYYFSAFNTLTQFFTAFFALRSISFLAIATIAHRNFKSVKFPKLNFYLLIVSIIFSLIFSLLF